jgi:hypothetical protein
MELHVCSAFARTVDSSFYVPACSVTVLTNIQGKSSTTAVINVVVAEVMANLSLLKSSSMKGIPTNPDHPANPDNPTNLPDPPDPTVPS